MVSHSHSPPSIPTSTPTNPPINTNITRRFDPNDYAGKSDFDKYVSKGRAFVCALYGSDRYAGTLLGDTREPPSAASRFQGDLIADMQTWYWHRVANGGELCDVGEQWDAPFAMKSLGISDKSTQNGGGNRCFVVEHNDRLGKSVAEQFYSVGERMYRATGANYMFDINPRAGAIFCFYLTSPKSAANANWYAYRRDPDVADLPALRALSDILWGHWKRNNPTVNNIRYFLMLGVSNEMTNQLIAMCLQNVRKELKEWPGTKFSTTTDGGKALLGSPNGAAFAYFLIQHKAQLGPKVITNITIFRPENEDENSFVEASMVFHVTDGPEPGPNSQ